VKSLFEHCTKLPLFPYALPSS